MRASTRRALLAQAAAGVDLVLGEGVMGLFDGPAGAESGSTAAIAAELRLPVVLVVDAAGMGASLGALVQGFAGFRRDVRLAGVIANNVASARHRDLLAEGCAAAGLPLLAALPRRGDLAQPARRHGLVRAEDTPEIAQALADWAAVAGACSDLPSLAQAAAPLPEPAESDGPDVPPPGQRVAIARDAAFAFAYPWWLAAWQAAGASLHPFSPLNDEAPPDDCDAVFLPGGWPEAHAGTLAAAERFHTGLAAAAARGAHIYGECGGFMALGEALIDSAGIAHRQAGLLPVTTSVTAPRLKLGYHRVEARAPVAGWPAGTLLAGHAFHYAERVDAGTAAPALVAASDDSGPAWGAVAGPVAGSFLHIIDRRASPGESAG